MSTRLSVNINKIATLRNARGMNVPNLLSVTQDLLKFGAQGITIHPRPDERHIKREDIEPLAKLLHQHTLPLNIEGYPDERLLSILRQYRPAQTTFVPDPPHVLTSSQGWNIHAHYAFLKDVIDEMHTLHLQVSLFIDPDPYQIEAAKKVGAHAIELYTGPYVSSYPTERQKSLTAYIETATLAQKMGLLVHAGHDLNLQNIPALVHAIPYLAEVSIGHALICEALYYGLENVVAMYLRHLHTK